MAEALLTTQERVTVWDDYPAPVYEYEVVGLVLPSGEPAHFA